MSDTTALINQQPQNIYADDMFLMINDLILKTSKNPEDANVIINLLKVYIEIIKLKEKLNNASEARCCPW